ncbi:protein kinase-like domain, concanavalin A-like lectin/glucanase domain protein [Tanacetum coccineum]
MIGKINLLRKSISEKLNNASSLKNARNFMAPKSIAEISHDEREELRKKGIKSPSKFLSPKYLSPASIKELNKNPSSPKCVHFVNSIVILSTYSDTKEEDVSSTNACDPNLSGMVKGKEREKEQGNEENEIETDMEVDEVIKEEECEFETDEEIKEILEEEDDEDGKDKSRKPEQNQNLLHGRLPLEALLLDLQSDLVPPPVDVDFDDHGVSEFAICNHLSKVVLSGRMNVGDIGVVLLVKSTQKLQILNLEGCINVTDQTLIATGELADLRYLNLKDCSRITDLGLKHLADGESKSSISHIESLWALDISKLNVTDVSLVEISSRCRSLHSILLNGCMAIMGDGFRDLTNCGWIGELAVVDCPNITWDDVVFVGYALEVLEYLSLDRRIENPVPEASSK